MQSDRLTLVEERLDKLVEISRGNERTPAEIQSMAMLLLAQAVVALAHEVRALRPPSIL